MAYPACIWNTASSSSEYLQTGWIGRFLDAYGNNDFDAIQVDESLSLALKGASRNGIATNNAKRFFRHAQTPYFNKIVRYHEDEHLSEHNLGYLYKTLISAKSSAKYIYETSKTHASNFNYPDKDFGRQLKTIAEFINSGLSTQVYYASLGDFDTHADQGKTQDRLLKLYSDAIEVFVNDLKKNGTFKDTLILTFSEFGRRVEQNAAIGTDHGAANNVFVIGEHLRLNGFYNPLSDLTDLDANGDIKYEIDFRSIYATILNNWLNVNPSNVLRNEFSPLDFI